MYSKAFQDFLKVVERNDYVILDTETTGLSLTSEIIEIAVIDPECNVLVNERIKPKFGVPSEASAVHGIFDRDLENARSWEKVRNHVLSYIVGKDVIIYNASYDFGMFHKSDAVCGLPKLFYDDMFKPHCAMLWYAEWWGDWNDYRGSYRWQKLTDACDSLAIPVVNAHGALGDCLMTRKVIGAVIAELTDRGDL